MITFFAVAVLTAIVALTFVLLAGWLINRPDTGRRAKPLSIEDQRTIRWAKALNPKNVHGAGETEAAAKAASGPTSADRPAGPVRSNVSRPGSAAGQLPVANEGHTGPGHRKLPLGETLRDGHGSRDRDPVEMLPGGHSRSGSLSPRTSKTPGSVAAAGAHSEACDGCTVMGCGSGCKCACHWGTPGPVVVRADAWYDPAFGFDFAGLLDRADAVLAGATC